MSSQNTTNKKLIYILPEASQVTHMKYNVEFITALVKERGVDIYLILERGLQGGGSAAALCDLKEKTGVKEIKYTGNGNPFLRILKLTTFLLQAKRKGYKKCYVHYSFVGVFWASILGFKTYYWNCGIPWQYERPFFQELYETAVYKLINHFVTGANVLTKKYSDFYNFDNKKSIVIPNWIDIKHAQEILLNTDKSNLRQELNISENNKVLFFNQRLAIRKGAHYIPQILENTNEDVVIIITNDGPYKEKLIQILREKNLFERTRMLGRVPNEKVINILAITDIYVLPSEEEGMSHSLMEAMATATAAVAFDVGGTVDMYPEDFKKYCLPPKSINWFVEKVQELLGDEKKREDLGKALFEMVQEYDKGKVLDIFVEKVMS